MLSTGNEAANPEEISLDDVIAEDPDEIDLDGIPSDVDEADGSVNDPTSAADAVGQGSNGGSLDSMPVRAPPLSGPKVNPEEIETDA